MKLLHVVFVTVVEFPLFAAAQTDLCWREAYPQVPGQWAGYGSAVEAGNRFKAIAAVTVELWATSSDYAEAQRRLTAHQKLPATLVRTVMSDQQGMFRLGEFQPGFYEMRARLGGRETAVAFIDKQAHPTAQWMGRGLRIAMSFQDKGCSRIYPAGLDDTDCGALDCGGLPTGTMRVVRADGTPLSQMELLFHRHSKSLGPVELTLLTDADGFVNIVSARGCYDISIGQPRRRSMHLCFRQEATPADFTVVLPPEQSPPL